MSRLPQKKIYKTQSRAADASSETLMMTPCSHKIHRRFSKVFLGVGFNPIHIAMLDHHLEQNPLATPMPNSAAWMLRSLC